MTCISIKEVTKRYGIYSNRYKLLNNLLLPFITKTNVPKHYALNKINLNIIKGQCVGIIGRNGSGKSTLLRIIAGIIRPTSGTVSINGKLSTILDISSGLHPRLTGIQNIFLKSTMHGNDRRKTSKMLQKIVEFSGLEQYIDYPISTYSSGMIIRLGFSIALHVDFDILLMDEILSVGDIVFQRQCLAKIREFKSQEKTIVIATHNLGDVSAVCNRLIMLQNGSLVHDDDTENVLKQYWDICKKEGNKIPRHLHPLNPENIYGTDTKEVHITDVAFLDKNGKRKNTFHTGDYMAVVIKFNATKPVNKPLFRVQFYRNEGLMVHGTNTRRARFDTGVISGKGEIKLEYLQLNILEGEYYASVGVWPDEFKSFMVDMAYDCHQWQYIVKIVSNRGHGGGLVYNRVKWSYKGTAP
jgi:ABC-type polysaccharide/polyol phosphate transport system ATPase subunit